MGINLLADEKPINLLADEENQIQEFKPEGTNPLRSLMIGLFNQRQNFVNTPHDIVHGLETVNNIRKLLSFENHIGKNPTKSDLTHPISKLLPYEQNNYEQLMGQKGKGTILDRLIQKGVEHAPEIAGATGLLRTAATRFPISSRGIINRMSAHKTHELQHARTEYGNLFNEANQQGITHVAPPHSATANRTRITANSQAKHHRALNEYLNNPTLENAHWAQSELGSLERHLDSIANRNGLTPTQHRTLRAAQQARNDIRNEMFSNNALGSNPALGERYQTLSNQYREHVIPYTRLEELTEAEHARMRPKTAVKKLLKDEQFMIELARRYPGIFLHTPSAKKVKNTALGIGATIGGYEGIKKLIKEITQ